MFKSSNRRKITAGIIAGLFVLSAFVLASVASGGDKVSICHRNSGVSNPVLISVSVNAWDDENGNGHWGHRPLDYEADGGVCGCPPERQIPGGGCCDPGESYDPDNGMCLVIPT